jgi:hypothetical protein
MARFEQRQVRAQRAQIIDLLRAEYLGDGLT